MGISDSMERERREEEAIRAPWALGDYTGKCCPSCGRERLCSCPNGKTRCEKCNWIVEDNIYCPVS